MMTKDEAMQMALTALLPHKSTITRAYTPVDAAIDALRTALAQPEPEPVAWVYPEGLEALKNGKPWTAYGTKQEENNTPLYLNPPLNREPYAWVTFNAYGEEDDVWYENPEGNLLEGWTYKPLYDTAPQKKEWVGLTDEERKDIFKSCGVGDRGYVAAMVEAKLKEKNT